MKTPQTRYRIPDFYGDNNWHIVNIPDQFPFSTTNPLSTITADLNNQWVLADESTDSSIIDLAGNDYIVVKSNSNYHVNNGVAVMYVNFSSNEDVVFKIMNRGENRYDYPTVTLSDGTSSEILYNDKQNTKVFTQFTVTSPMGKQLIVNYKKDFSGNTDLDRAFLAIPNTAQIVN